MQTDELTTQLLRNNEPLPIPQQNLTEKVWFLRDERGKIHAVDEGAAWRMFYAPGRKFAIVGVSHGESYAKAIDEVKKLKTPEEKRAFLLKAFDEAVEEARGHIEYPRNPNKLDINGQFITDPRVKNIIDGRE